MDRVKTIANRYKVIKKLGNGTQGYVYLIQDTEDYNQEKALKKTLEHLVKENEKEMIEREAKLLAGLNHQNILKYYDSFMERNQFHVVTEYCEGGDLETVLKALSRKKLKLEERHVLRWFHQLMLGIEYIHSKNIIHRDVKPSNIYLKNDNIKLGDFGISRIIDNTRNRTDLTLLVGTPIFMAPEVVNSEQYNSKADVWSCGCVLYQMCTFKEPFDCREIFQLFKMITEKDAPDLPIDEYSTELNYIYKKMLIKDHKLRPTAAEVLSEGIISELLKKHNLTTRPHRDTTLNKSISIVNNTETKTPENKSTLEIMLAQLITDTIQTRPRPRPRRNTKTDSIDHAKTTYKITVKTSNIIGAGTDANISIKLFGTNGQGEELNLINSLTNNDSFERNQTDIFECKDVRDVGDIQMVYVCHDETGIFSGSWHLEYMIIENQSTKKQYKFDCNKWFSLSRADKQIFRVLTINNSIKVINYKISVYTGDVKDAGTDANVHITLYGEKESSGRRPLKQRFRDLFERAQIDTFMIESIDLGKIQRVVIEHDSTSRKKSWFLSHIVVENMETHEAITFECNKWLDENQDDGLTQRTLHAK